MILKKKNLVINLGLKGGSEKSTPRSDPVPRPVIRKKSVPRSRPVIRPVKLTDPSFHRRIATF